MIEGYKKKAWRFLGIAIIATHVHGAEAPLTKKIPIPNFSVHSEICTSLSKRAIDGLLCRYEPEVFRAKVNDSLHCDVLYCGLNEENKRMYVHSAPHARMLIDVYKADPNQMIPWGEKKIPLIYERVYCLQFAALKFLLHHGARPSIDDTIRFATTEVPLDLENERVYSLDCEGCTSFSLHLSHSAECDQRARYALLSKKKKLASIIEFLVSWDDGGR